MGVVAEAVQSTAFVAAACRALETGRPHPRLRDEYAGRFVAAQEAGQTTRARITDAGTDEVVQRSRLLDAALIQAVSRQDDQVVLNLGAGFCARPYRLDLSGCRKVVECDAEAVMEVKNRVLADARPSCPVERVVADVRSDLDLVLAACGDGPVIVLSEGLLVYLSRLELSALATTLATAAQVRSWLADVVSESSAQGMRRVAAQAGARVILHGMASLDEVETTGWRCVDYRILPTPRRGGLAGTGAGAASRQVVDGVVTWER